MSTDPMHEFHRIAMAVKERDIQLIGVDGALGAGKTTIALRLSSHLKWPCIHLDSFLIKGQETFASSIRYASLRQAVDSLRGFMIIEGICLLAVLHSLSITPDLMIYVDHMPRVRGRPRSQILTSEVDAYFNQFSPRAKADIIISLEPSTMTSPNDIDIAYLHSKTLIAVVLAIGGLLQTICGALLLNSGLNEPGSATLKIMGTEISATGFGGILLCTSAIWAFLAFRARPHYIRISESTSRSHADGSSESSDYVSSTQMAVSAKKPRIKVE